MLLPLAVATLCLTGQAPTGLDLKPHLSGHTAPMSITASALSGKGAELIQEAIGDSKFVVIGEEHFILEVPLFAEGLFRTLNREKGFEYLVVENDPYALELLGNSQNRNSLKNRTDVIQKYPNLLAFSMPQEIKLLDAVYEVSKAARPVIGVDQNIGALHVLHRLQELADNDQSRAAIGSLLAKVDPIDSKRAGPNSPHYMSSPDALPDIEKLRAGYTTKSEEADRLLALMLRSANVYSLWRKGSVEPTANFTSNSIREQYMKEQFSRQYRQISAQNPKMVAKFGMNHSFRGVNQIGVAAIGNLLGELAIYEGSTSTGIAIVGKAKGAYANSPWLRQFIDECSKDQDTVIDLRPMRLKVKAGQLQVDAATSRFLDGFDLLVVIGSPTPMPLN